MFIGVVLGFFIILVLTSGDSNVLIFTLVFTSLFNK